MLTCLGLASVPVTLGTYVFGHWLPDRIRYAQAEQAVKYARAQTERYWQRIGMLRARIEKLKRIGDDAPPWAYQRATHQMLEKLGQCFIRGGAELRRMRSDEPVLCGVAGPEDVLPADPITIETVGTYTALTEALEQISTRNLPLRVQQLDWIRGQDGLRLVLKAQIPLCADETIRDRLAGGALLEALEAAREP